MAAQGRGRHGRHCTGWRGAAGRDMDRQARKAPGNIRGPFHLRADYGDAGGGDVSVLVSLACSGIEAPAF